MPTGSIQGTHMGRLWNDATNNHLTAGQMETIRPSIKHLDCAETVQDRPMAHKLNRPRMPVRSRF